MQKESNNKTARNKLVNEALQTALKSNPSPVYHKDAAAKVTTGNFEDNLKDIQSCDWIIEVVVERLDIKQSLYEKVEQHRRPGTLITSNTSGIPIHLLSNGRSDDFKNISAARTFSIPHATCGCWRLFPRRIRIKMSLISSCIMAICTLVKPPCWQKIRLPLLPTASASLALWLFST
jgi:hypothetical protein